jgi:epoxyqueuosine reductase
MGIRFGDFTKPIRTMDISAAIRNKLKANGASIVGFADISELQAETRQGMSRGISIGVALNPRIISQIASGPTQDYYNEYRRANSLLTQLCKMTVDLLNDSGYRGVSLEPTTENFDSKTLSAPIPHKTIATRAGLGWIGKSALLVTEEFGTAIRLSTVITDAEVEPTSPTDESRCGECELCVQNCPASSIRGQNWQKGTAREELYDAFACRETAKQLSVNAEIPSTICGICIVVCPWTRRYIDITSDE